MIEETRAALPHLCRVDLFRIARKPTEIDARLKWTSTAQAIRVVARLSSIDRLAHETVALVVMNWRDWPVDWNLVKVWTTETQQLCIEVRKQPPLQQWIVSEINSRDDVSGVKSDLLCFGEEVFHITIQRQPADATYRNELLRNDLGRIEQIEWKTLFVFLLDDLNTELPFRKVAILDRFPEIA